MQPSTQIERVEEELHTALGKKIREKRQSSGLTQAELAARIEVSRSSLTNMELGRQRLLIDQLYKMADVLNTNPQDLLPSRAEIISASRESVDEPIPASVQRFADRIRARDSGTKSDE